MNLKLNRPLAFFDLETTGTMIGSDRIIEIAILKLFPDGKEESFTSRINPEMAIPGFITELTGISNEHVKGQPTFKEIAPQIKKMLDDCDLAGYNSNKFDIPFLVEEMDRVGEELVIRGRNLIDVQNIFHKMEPRTLKAAYQFYCQKDLTNAHAADADTSATKEIFLAQLEKYEDLKDKDLDYLHKFTNMHNTVDLAGRLVYNDKQEVIVNFGKHKGKLLTEVFEKEPSYYDWIQRGDFSRETKSTFKNLWDEYQNSRLKSLNTKR
jgi:DNA polymerase III subunit epsilon